MTKQRIAQAESLMTPGHFQHAARIYEELGMNDKYKQACFECSKDCFEVGLYALSVEYANRTGNKKLGKAIRSVCEEETLYGQCDMCEEGCLDTIIEAFNFEDNVALEEALRHRGRLDLDDEIRPPCNPATKMGCLELRKASDCTLGSERRVYDCFTQVAEAVE